MIHSAKSFGIVLLCSVAVVGCGGGDGDETLGIVVTPDGRVLAGSEPIETGDFVGRTFPLLYASAEDKAPQAVAETGTGSIEVVDEDVIVITLPGGLERTFNRISPTEYSDGAGKVLELLNIGPAQYLSKADDDPTTEIVGSFGFETPVVLRPLTATYAAKSASVLMLVPDGSSLGFWIGAPGTVDLIARFNGSGGTITGTLFDGDGVFDFDGDGAINDDLSVRISLDGVIDRGGFGGTVDGSASVSLAGALPQDLDLRLSDTSVNGKFFGNDADVVSGTYSGATSITPPGEATETGKLSGFFIAE